MPCSEDATYMYSALNRQVGPIYELLKETTFMYLIKTFKLHQTRKLNFFNSIDKPYMCGKFQFTYF